MSEDPDERKVAAAARTLALLNAQADGMRRELAKLRREVTEAQREFSATQSAQLQEANEHLVLAALHSENLADTAMSTLDEVVRSSQRDALTGTPNRALMLDRLESAIALARRHETRFAVLFLDLDDFKQINDALGHSVGDELLHLVARRLESVVRDSDTVSRHSGDEFLVLLAEVSQPSDAALIAAKMLAALAAPARVGDHELHLSASIGIAIYPEDGDDPNTLISRADAAMYRSKKDRGGSFAFHQTESSSDHNLEPPAVDLLRQPLTRREIALNEHILRLRDLREANEQLVMAALSAQELEADAEEAHRRQITFLAMVVHELRNPLCPIRSAAELLNSVHADEPQLARLQEIIESGVAHMSRLVDDLLDGSRVSTGKFRLQRSNVELSRILSMAVETCRTAIDKRLQHLKLQLPPGPLNVQGDAIRLAQVFSNLLDNASKYTPEGGEIALAVVEVANAIAITVSDNGIGITAEVLPHIFDLFTQDTHALALHSGGLGIGLAVVRDLVEAHGGSVVGKSAGRGLGSEFVVTLPRADGAVTAMTD